ncbi:alpha/beta fold hydrolase [Sphingomonas sp.]|jgi:pimeloyl-ACP methyl ester carboxylesterase|uniref:alpha/beta fold hydrolase n=1 Tax=Sphingomonas sp. TaxID=28214 RepID=UPI003569E76F
MRWQRLGYTALGVFALLLLAFLYFRTPDTDPAAMRAKYGAPPSQFVDLGGGLTVHLRDTGPRDAQALMLIHGANASLHTWEPWAARLGDRYRVIRIDLPGHGLTGASPTGDYSPKALASVIERVRVRLNVDRLIVVGSSMGGGVAWHYALLNPGHVRALVLADSVGQPNRAAGNPSLVFQVMRVPLLRDLALAITPRDMVADGLRSAFHDRRQISDAMVDRSWELLRYPGNRSAMLDRFTQPSDVASVADLRQLAMPTLILWGADDRMIPVSSAQWLHAHIPGSKIIIYPNTGHALMEERSDQSASDLARFIEALPADSAAGRDLGG